MQWPGKAAPSSTRRPASATRPPDHRLVRRVRGFDPAAGYRSATRTDAMRFMGATFDPSALYRFNAVRRMLAENGLTTATDFGACRAAAGALARRDRGHAAWARPSCSIRSTAAARSLPRLPQPGRAALVRPAEARNCITDVRGDVLRDRPRALSRRRGHRAPSRRWPPDSARAEVRGEAVVGDARRPRRALPCPTRRSAGRGRHSSP